MAPTITVSPASGPTNTLVTVSGTGFPANEVVGLYFDKPGLYLGFPGPRTTSQGTFIESDATPVLTPGRHQICADTMHPNAQPVAALACAPFVVIASPSASPAPRQGGATVPIPVAIAIGVIGILIGVALGAAFWRRRQPES